MELIRFLDLRRDRQKIPKSMMSWFLLCHFICTSHVMEPRNSLNISISTQDRAWKDGIIHVTVTKFLVTSVQKKPTF